MFVASSVHRCLADKRAGHAAAVDVRFVSDTSELGVTPALLAFVLQLRMPVLTSHGFIFLWKPQLDHQRPYS